MDVYQVFCDIMRRKGKVRTKEIANILNISITTARKKLNKLVKEGKIKFVNKGRASYYTFNI